MLDLIFALNVRLNIEMLWFERVKAVVNDLLERGMVAPELVLLKLSGKFGLLTQMIV